VSDILCMLCDGNSTCHRSFTIDSHRNPLVLRCDGGKSTSLLLHFLLPSSLPYFSVFTSSHFSFFVFHFSFFIFHFSFFIFHFSFIIFRFLFSFFIYHFSFFIYHLSFIISHIRYLIFHFSFLIFHFLSFLYEYPYYSSSFILNF
jgi:hypothetical protein